MLFRSSTPNNSVQYTMALAKKHYGMDVIKADVLACERDQIFLLTTTQNDCYIWRYTHSSEIRELSCFQTQVMLHVTEQAPEIPAPRVIPTLKNNAEVLVNMENGKPSVVIVITCLPGYPIAKFGTCSSSLRANMAQTLAALDTTLKSFHHVSQQPKLLWDIQHLLDLRQYQHFIKDKSLLNLVVEGFNLFEQNVAPKLSSLRSQVIHNDLNFSNVMVEKADSAELSGIIDFGDAIYGPLIQEVGVAATYHLMDSETPLDNVVEFVSSFHKTLPLKKQELELLFDFIIARCVMTVVIVQWHAGLHPENSDYILRNHDVAANGLKRLLSLGRDTGQKLLIEACAV